jgi:toxin ParE1/3/4
MAELIWTEPALGDLDAIADYIALDKPEAAREWVRRLFKHVGQLIEQPESGSRVPELRGLGYRQIVESPCRVFYRFDGKQVFILHVLRGEMLLQKRKLVRRDKRPRRKG